jgi:hypothetical protein
MPVTNCSGKIGVICLLLNASVVHASGSLPTVVEKTKYKSHADCVASLQNDLQQDRDQTTDGRIGFRDGMTRQVTLITDGLVTQSHRVTRYQSELWRSYGGPTERPRVPDVQETPQMRFSHSYEKRLRVCKGQTKTVTTDEGYTLDTFE